MAKISSHEMSFVSCVSCNIEVEDDESSMEGPEVKLGGGEFSKRDVSVVEAGRGGLLSAG